LSNWVEQEPQGTVYVMQDPVTHEIISAKGDTGATGPQGLQGETGPTGADSTVPGPQGSQGATGATGATGADSTVQGPQGATGSTGAQGTQGTQGTAGATGSTGADSTVPGPQGIQGETGATGAAGAKGDTGTAGAAGAKGDTGTTGAAGSTGAKGDAGTAGTNGTDGIDGVDGAAGSGQKVVSFALTDTPTTLLTLLADETIDVIEMASGTYHFAMITINIDRANPVIVRPAHGAVVVFSGDTAGGNPQFAIGAASQAGNITFDTFTFDGFILAQQGIIQPAWCHDIAFNNMTVINSRCNGTTAAPYNSWCIYIYGVSGHSPVRFTANNWTVTIASRLMGGLQIEGGTDITACDWEITGAVFAINAQDRDTAVTRLILDHWNILDCGNTSTPSVAVQLGSCDGRYSNFFLDALSGIITNAGMAEQWNGIINKPYIPTELEMAAKAAASAITNVDNTSDATKNAAAVTLTNKRVTRRVDTQTTTDTITPEISTYDIFIRSAQAHALVINNHSSSTPVNGDMMLFEILSDATIRAITYGNKFVAKAGVALPAATVASKNLTLLFIWRNDLTQWVLLSAGQEA